MKSPIRYIVVPFAVVSITRAMAACGSSDQPAASTTVTDAPTNSPPTVPALAVETPEATDTPARGPVDGTFLVGEGSEVTFTVNEKLSSLPLPNDAVLRTGAITGEIDLSSGVASLVIDLHALRSDQSRRDRYVRDRMFSRQREATISITEFPEIPDSFASGESFFSTVSATANIKGTDADIEFEIEARLDPDRLLVLAKGDFVWADFGMTAPTSRAFVVKDALHVEVLVSARR